MALVLVISDMPPLPPWEGLHPLVVHFPIGLLFVAPVFVLLGLVTGLRSLMFSALVLMILGTAGAWVATSTGEAAYDVMPLDDMELEDDVYDEAYEVADRHWEKAEQARNYYTGLTVLFAVLILLPAFRTPQKPDEANPEDAPKNTFVLRAILSLIFLALWAYPTVIMANAAHDGGRLVHEFGIRAILAETAEADEEESEEADAEATDTEEADAA